MKVKLMDTGHDIFRMNDHFRYIFRTNVPIIFTCIFSSEKRACHVQVYDKPKLLWKTIFICWWYHPHVHAWRKDKKKKLPLLFFKDLDHEKLDDIWHIQIKIYYHSVWKSPKNVSFIFLILVFSNNSCPIKKWPVW